MKRNEDKVCYLCLSGNLELIKQGTRDNPDVNLLKCNRCGLQQLGSFEHMTEEYYTESHMTYPLKCILDDDRRVNELKDVLLEKDVLEFGSGLGGFCRKIKKYVNKIVAIDLDFQAKSTYEENNIPFFQKLDNLEDSSFDCVVMFHVLEHVEDPIYQLSELRRVLKKDGVIYVEVPNANDALLDIYNSEEFLKFNTYSGHLFTFNPENLKSIASKAGLKTGYIKQVQRYPLSNHLVWFQDGKPLGHVKYDFLNERGLNNAYASALARVGACDTLFAKFTLE